MGGMVAAHLVLGAAVGWTQIERVVGFQILLHAKRNADEATGALDTMLNKVADVYDEEVTVLVDGLVSMLEPMMVVILGVIVGFIVIALFMPLIKLLNDLS